MIALPPLILILGEIIPKSIGRQQATLLAQTPGPHLLGGLLGDLSHHPGLRRPSAAWSCWATGVRKTGQLPFITREDLRLVVTKSGPEVDLEGTERHLHPPHPAVQPAHRQGGDGAPGPGGGHSGHPTVTQALEEFRSTRYSRLPVYHRRIDNLIGVLHDFDLLGGAAGERPIKAFMRPVNYVPELKKIDRLAA